MAETIKAIETRYNGRHYRSRLEARWAVFFDTLGLSYEYEPEGFEFDGMRYLPDFYIREWDAYVEIKGTLAAANDDRRKHRAFVSQKQSCLYVAIGQPLTRMIIVLLPRTPHWNTACQMICKLIGCEPSENEYCKGQDGQWIYFGDQIISMNLIESLPITSCEDFQASQNAASARFERF